MRTGLKKKVRSLDSYFLLKKEVVRKLAEAGKDGEVFYSFIHKVSGSNLHGDTDYPD
jgi:hypothetical protein